MLAAESHSSGGCSIEPNCFLRCGCAFMVMDPAGLFMLSGRVALKSVWTCSRFFWLSLLVGLANLGFTTTSFEWFLLS